MTITYRPATPADFGFLYGLHEATMRVYVEDTFGEWDEAWQRAYFRHRGTNEARQIIQLDGRDVGVICVQDRAEELFLVDIEVLPAYQSRGIGATVIHDLLERARGQGKPVALQVLKRNVRARSLYQRLGFGVTGETETHYIMAHGKL